MRTPSSLRSLSPHNSNPPKRHTWPRTGKPRREREKQYLSRNPLDPIITTTEVAPRNNKRRTTPLPGTPTELAAQLDNLLQADVFDRAAHKELAERIERAKYELRDAPRIQHGKVEVAAGLSRPPKPSEHPRTQRLFKTVSTARRDGVSLAEAQARVAEEGQNYLTTRTVNNSYTPPIQQRKNRSFFQLGN